ncbi:RNA-dependent RNA polymerase [Heterobasidion mitovirus 1]|uniref:RNA-dependent RNA polymerase n=1 Tax=Heterobasidion mitovirus 1 TaxID=1521172 RepID=A0ABM5QKM7_9VIRU|nr:RNA-dependent RNA polymerase [Heterobasidion mitovirus 1]AIF33766.2 RNA-dependent RNA polymerase [Heterobasidion mitovirus 1]
MNKPKLKLNFKHKLFHYRLFELDNANAMLLRNQGRPWLGIIARLFPAMGGRLSQVRMADCKAFLLHTNLIAKRQGIKGAVMHLKVSGVALQQAIAGHVLKDLTPLGPRVARTKSGLPKFLPLLWRQEIVKGNTFIIILALTMISLFRVLKFPAQAKLGTITNPFKGNRQVMLSLQKYIPVYVGMILQPLIRRGMDATDWVKGRTTPFPILTSSPTSVSADDEISTSPHSIWRAIYSFVQRNVIAGGDPGSPKGGTLYHALLQIMSLGGSNVTTRFTWGKFSQGTLNWYDIDMNDKSFETMWHFYQESNLVAWVMDMGKKIFGTGVRFSRNEKGPARTSWEPLSLGKLGFHDEAAGKVRVFAMVDPLTQWALRPIHKLLFLLLRYIPMDGTFDQLKPITRLLAQKPKVLDSLDLSAATDRLPIAIQEWIISKIFTPSIGKAWTTLLVGRDYRVPKRDGQTTVLPKSVTYAVGQPMGALSSWAMLAITHHFIVQIAAWQSGVTKYGKWFTAYALLGDDLTVGNRAVSNRYQLIMIKHLGVEVGLAKSIISDKGIGLEFAKKTFFKGIDVSPRPIKELLGALQTPAALVSYARKYKLTDAQIIKVAGFGYKVLGGLNKPLQKQNTSVRFTLITLHLPASILDLRKTYESMRSWFKRQNLVEWLLEFITSEARVLRNKLRNVDNKISAIYTTYVPSSSRFEATPEFLGWFARGTIQQILSDITWIVTWDYSYRMRTDYNKIMTDLLKIETLKEDTLSLYKDFGIFPGEIQSRDFSNDLYYIYLESLQGSSKWSLDSLNLERPEEREGVNLQISRFYNNFNKFIRKLIGTTKEKRNNKKGI